MVVPVATAQSWLLAIVANWVDPPPGEVTSVGTFAVIFPWKAEVSVVVPVSHGFVVCVPYSNCSVPTVVAEPWIVAENPHT